MGQCFFVRLKFIVIHESRDGAYDMYDRYVQYVLVLEAEVLARICFVLYGCCRFRAWS